MTRMLTLLACGLALSSAGCHADLFHCEHNSDLHLKSVSWTGAGGVDVAFGEYDPDQLCDGDRTYDADGHATEHATAPVDCADPAASCVEPKFSSASQFDYALADGSLASIENWSTLVRRDPAGELVYSHALPHLDSGGQPPISQARHSIIYVALVSDDVRSVAKIDLVSGNVIWSTPVLDRHGLR